MKLRGKAPSPLRGAALAATAIAAIAAGGCGSSSSSAPSASSPAASTPTQAEGVKVATTPAFTSPAKSAPVMSGTVQISYRNIAIHPDTVRVRVGSTIVWTNHDPIEHNVTSEGGSQTFASKGLQEGSKFSIVANRPGVIHYECTIHPASMNGTIEVVR